MRIGNQIRTDLWNKMINEMTHQVENSELLGTPINRLLRETSLIELFNELYNKKYKDGFRKKTI
jgi:hypothetical protein